MIRYSKPLGKLLDFKQEFFHSNDFKLEQFKKISEIYRAQPHRKLCKNCNNEIKFNPKECFVKFGVEYSFCPRCNHCNGAYEDTNEFCRILYTKDEGKDYAREYISTDDEQYNKRVQEVYTPKALFLKEALEEVDGFNQSKLVDFGAGAGYFVSAALRSGFKDVIGYEPSETLVKYGNAIIGEDRLKKHNINDIVNLIKSSEATIASFIAVLEHLQSPRFVLKSLSENRNIKYIYFSVPLFSPTVVIESVFKEIMPRHLVAGHTHLYTEDSINYFCNEFGFVKLSEWWFGLDFTDLSRSITVSLEKNKNESGILIDYWNNNFMPMIDRLQRVLDEEKCGSEVHMLIGKK